MKINDWEIGQSEVLLQTPIYSLKVKREVGKKIPKNFNAENIKFKVGLYLHNKKTKELSLNDKSIQSLKDGLLKIFYIIKKSYTKRNGPIYIQLNLGFNGLKKIYLKSGIVNLFDKTSHNVVFWLINQLDQVEQSSDNLVFTKNFECDFLLLRTVHPAGILRNEIFNSTSSKMAYYSLKINMNNLFFLDKIKNGNVDIELVFNKSLYNNSLSCIFSSVHFGLIYERENFDLRKSVLYVTKKFNDALSFENSFKNQYKVFSYEYLKTKSVTFVIDHISKKIARDIIIFKKNDDNYASIIYNTEYYPQLLPIKLIFDNKHCTFIFDERNLEKKGFIFCSFCRKSFRCFMLHKCIRKKCPRCFLYYESIDPLKSELVCNSKRVKNVRKQCMKCKKYFNNNDCFLRHLKLSKSYCQKTLFCDFCKQHFNFTKNHICGEKFCQRCLSTHKSLLFCPTKELKRKKISSNFFFSHIQQENGLVISISLLTFGSDNAYEILRFSYIDKCYFKISINKNNFCERSIEEHFYSHKLTFEDIIQYLEISNLKPIFLLDKNNFNYILDNVDLIAFKLYTFSNDIVLAESKYYSFCLLDRYQKLDDVSILKKINISINPLYLITPPFIGDVDYNETLEDARIDLFLEEYKSSDLTLMSYLKSFLPAIDIIRTLKKSEFLKESSISYLIVRHKFLEMVNMTLIQIIEFLKSYGHEFYDEDFSITKFSSFSSAIFFIFNKVTKDLPTLPSSKPGNIRNTSKYEISFVNGLNKIHKQKYKDHEIFSYVNKNGEQFKVKNFTADWFCKSCKIAFFIEGQFKYICNNHKLPFDKRRAYLNENGLRKRKLFKKISKLEVDQIFVIGQCCIVKKDYPQLFKESNLYDSKLPQMVLNNLKVFKKEKYDRIHYQKAILPPFTLYLEKEFRASGGSSATKYDINSAYLSCLTNPSFLLPESNQPIKIFVNEDSNKYFQSLKSEDKIFAIMKAFIVVPLNTEFPFLPIRSKDKGIGYSFCYKCFKSDCKPELCSHSDSERGFFSEGYLSDFLFMKKMGYKITCVHIIEFKAMHHKGLHDIAACLLQLRKVDSDIVRTISKLCALIGIGRYALNQINLQIFICYTRHPAEYSEPVASDQQKYAKSSPA